MDCDICITFERGMRDLEAELAEKVRRREAADALTEGERIFSQEALEAAVSELFMQRRLYDRHRRSSHETKTPASVQQPVHP